MKFFNAPSIFISLALLVGSALFVKPVQATVCSGPDICVEGRICINTSRDPDNPIYQNFGSKCGGSAVVGGITPPRGVTGYNIIVGGAGSMNNIGIIVFASRILNILTIIAGIWVMFNFIYAGYIYITSSGDPQAHSRVIEKVTYSAIGIMVVALAYTIAALIGLVLFGDAGFILSPDPVTIQEINP